MYLVRVNGPVVVIKTDVHGLYSDPGDTWSGKNGHLCALVVHGRPAVRAAAERREPVPRRSDRHRDGRRPTCGRRATFPRTASPVSPSGSSRAPGRVCRVRFDVAKTLVPAKVVPGSTDTRPLGVHFLRFDYLP